MKTKHEIVKPMDIEDLLDKTYQQMLWGIRFFKNVYSEEVMNVVKDVAKEFVNIWISWIVLTGNVTRVFLEVVILHGILWWLPPFNSGEGAE